MTAQEALDAGQFDGMTVEHAAAIIGKPEHAARAWLFHRGYRSPGRVVRRITGAMEHEDAINQRLATAAPTAPCFRCGARMGCGHR